MAGGIVDPIIHRTVKSIGNGAHVMVPKDWTGDEVTVIRVDHKKITKGPWCVEASDFIRPETRKNCPIMPSQGCGRCPHYRRDATIIIREMEDHETE